MDVFILWHVHEFEDGSEDVKLIGVYSTRERAEAAKQRLLNQPGFCDIPEGFHIDRYPLDKDHWTEGYVTVRHDFASAAEHVLRKNAELYRRLA
jgi:hypothetical protein